MNTILSGDCRDRMKILGDESVQLTCTSPPYYNAKSYSTWPTYEEYLSFLYVTFKEVYRVTEKGRMCCVNLSPVIQPRESRNHESRRLPITFDFFTIMKGQGWKYIDDIVWEKQEGASINRNGNFFQMRKPVAYKPNIVTETIFIFQKPIDGLIDKVIKSYSDDVVKESLVEDGYERTNVWKFPPDTRSKHPAPYPTALSDRIIKYYSYKHDLVLDPFMGSGTTAVSAKNLDRRFVGCEIHEEYVKMAEERIAKVNPLAALYA